ncbi:hypothetical protein [Bacillus sp. R86525]|uniref:hypothetical protein n=1 Tax=Bacillus sp. R86525 TaxID=3101709 RepID=UPI00366AFDAF
MDRIAGGKFVKSLALNDLRCAGCSGDVNKCDCEWINCPRCGDPCWKKVRDLDYTCYYCGFESNPEKYN